MDPVDTKRIKYWCNNYTWQELQQRYEEHKGHYTPDGRFVHETSQAEAILQALYSKKIPTA